MIHSILNDVSSNEMMNVISRHSAVETIEKKARSIRLAKQNTIKSTPANLTTENGKGATAPRRRLYIPKGVSDQLLALSRGRPNIYF